MKVSLQQVHARREGLRSLLRADRYLSIAEICRLLCVSEATARRDLTALSQDGKITRTYGGALGDYEENFPAFRDRENQAPAAKKRIALAAVRQMQSGCTYFLDAGTTLLAVAKALTQVRFDGLRIVTNNLPVAEILSSIGGIETELLGGRFLSRQAVLLGKNAQQSLKLWQFDAAFLSAEGMTAEGLWNSQSEVVALQRSVLARTENVYFCLDATKIGHSTACPLARWAEVPHLISDANLIQLSNDQINLNARQLVMA